MYFVKPKVPVLNHYDASNFPKCNVRGRFTQATMYRLLLPTICAGHRVLYLDADTLVIGNIKELYDYSLGESQVIAGVRDTGIRPTHKYKLGIRDSIYVNAGVILFDFKNPVFPSLSKDWISIAQKRNLACNDQDIINMTCRHRIATVPSKFNVSSSTSLDLTDARIIHFAGPKEPWVAKLPHSEYWTEATRRYNTCHKPIN
jgi:lipopolysaccharide biosynthesis glycosyltransferase